MYKVISFLLMFPMLALAQNESVNINGENGVIKLYKESVVVEYDKNNSLVATSTFTIEKEILNENNINAFAEDEIYHGYFSKLEELKAYTLLSNGKGGYKRVETKNFKTSNSNADYIFYDDTKKTTITFPSLVKNARTLLEYTLFNKDAHFLNSFYFQSYLPAEQMIYEIEAPSDIEFNFVWKGDEAKWVEKTINTEKRKTTYTFKATNIPKFNIQYASKTIRNYVPHLIPIITKFKDGDKVKNYLSSSDDLYKYYFPHIQNINTTTDPTLKQKTEEICKGLTDPIKKAKAIYNWVQENIKYVAFEDSMGGFIPRQAKDVFAKRYGDCKDMSSIQVAMCRNVGVNANYTWVGTRDIPYKYEDVPTPMCDNHMIASLKHNNLTYILDGTHPEIPFGYIPSGIQGKEIMVSIDKDKYEIIKLPIASAEQNTTYDTTILKLDGLTLKGKVAVRVTGYPAWDVRISYKMIDPNKKDDFITRATFRGNNKYQAKDGEVILMTNDHKDLYVHSNFELKDFVQSAADELYINLNLKRSYEAQKIGEDQSKAIVDNQYAATEKQYLEFEIPEGYTIDYLPPSVKKAQPNHWSYNIVYKTEGNKIILIKDIKYELLDIETSQISAHNSLVDQLIEQYNESVVLKKKK